MQKNTAAGLKVQAKSIRTHLIERGVEVSHSDMLEALSKSSGFKDWNAASVSEPLSEPVTEVSSAVIRTSGGTLDVLNPLPSDIWIADIARGLSRGLVHGRLERSNLDYASLSNACVAVFGALPRVEETGDGSYYRRLQDVAGGRLSMSNVSSYQLRSLIYNSPKAYVGELGWLRPDIEEIEQRLRAAAYVRFNIPENAEQDSLVAAFSTIVSEYNNGDISGMEKFLNAFYHLTNTPDPYPA